MVRNAMLACRQLIGALAFANEAGTSVLLGSALSGIGGVILLQGVFGAS